MSERLVLKARLALGGAGEKVKIRWMAPSGAMPRPYEYQLLTSQLKERVAACRNALDALQKLADTPSEQGLSRALRLLTLSGEELYDVLMSGAGGRTADAQAFRAWFEATIGSAPADAWRIEFQHQEPETTMPWGLTCAPGAISGHGVAFEDYENLWAHRYIAASYCGALDSWEGSSKEIEGGSFQCSLLTEVKNPREPASFNLQIADHDGTDLTMWLTGPLLDHTVSRVSALREKFRNLRDWNHIVYLNLQTLGGSFSFPYDDERLTPDALQHITALIEERHAIAMIDREAIIRGDRGPEWVSTFFHQRWAGLIAVETDITAKALRYRGFLFLMELLARGQKLTDSLFEVRRQLWPFSLLYGVYSNPERVFVKPAPQVVTALKSALEARV